MTTLRIFNEKGITEFRECLKNISDGFADSVADGLLYDCNLSNVIDNGPEIDNRKFASRYDAAIYLHSAISSLKMDNKYYNTGLWTWLAAFYFEQICPCDKLGKRKIYSDYRYILNTGEWDRIFRHLLAGPVVIYDYHGDNAKLLLSNPMDKIGDFVIQLMGRQEIATNKSIIGVVNNLYWDPKRNAPKKGVSSTEPKPGSLRRFVGVLQQLELTYDFYSLTTDELQNLLPAEFDKWKQSKLKV